MYNKDNIFTKIINGELLCDKIYEDENILAFNDISQVAPIHILIIPKGEFTSIDDFASNADAGTVSNFFAIIPKIAKKLGIVESGYRLIMNHGPDAAQSVTHFHVHLIGGMPLGGLLPKDK